jgi:hypothetical protein
MIQIAVQDANILIDLVKTGLFDQCLALDYQFTTTNIILDELYAEQIELIQPHIISGKFTIIEITEEELIAIQLMSLENTKLSEQYWPAFYYPQKKAAILLTGDKRLRAIAETNELTVCGIFCVLD